jgi:hypothetical protein
MTRGVQHVQIADRPLERGIQTSGRDETSRQEFASRRTLRRPVNSNLGEIETGSDREAGKPGVVLYVTDAFFSNREEQFAIAHEAGGRIVHLRIVETECDHYGICLLLPMTRRNCFPA